MIKKMNKHNTCTNHAHYLHLLFVNYLSRLSFSETSNHLEKLFILEMKKLVLLINTLKIFKDTLYLICFVVQINCRDMKLFFFIKVFQRPIIVF